MGRVPLHRLPRRRRDRAAEPQSASVQPVLPGALAEPRRGAPRAMRGRRRDRRAGCRRPRRRRPGPRLRRAPAADPPGRVARPPAGRRDTVVVRGLRPTGARRRVAARRAVRCPAGTPRRGSAAGHRRVRGVPHPGDHRRRRRRALVHPIRGGGARRRDGQATRRHLRAGQAHTREGQTRTHRRLRGRRVPRPQGRRRRRLAAARPVRTRLGTRRGRSVGESPPGRRVLRVLGEVPARTAGRDGAAHARRPRRSSMGGVGGDVERRRPTAGRWLTMAGRQGHVVRAGARRARGRGHVRSTRGPPFPSWGAVRALASRPHARVVPLRPARRRRAGRLPRPARRRRADRRRLREPASPAPWSAGRSWWSW